MSKIQRTVTLMACLALVISITLVVLAILRTDRLETSARDLAIAATQEAFLSTYPAALVENSHPRFQTMFPADELISYLKNSQRGLGEFNSLVAIRGSTAIASFLSDQGISSAEFEIDLDFQNSPATVRIKMETVEATWQITDFSLSADLLMD